MSSRKLSFLLIITHILFISACTSNYTSKNKVSRKAHFQITSFKALKHWRDDTQLDALHALIKSCRVILKLSQHQSISKTTKLGGTVKNWFPICKEAVTNKISHNSTAQAFFEKWFTPYRVYDHQRHDIGKFTGYYEIELNGSNKKSLKYKYPIYASPQDIKHLKGKLHFSHAAINSGLLNGKGLEIAYTDNKAKLFFMHIQGSGVVKLAEGGELKIGYHSENGHAYKSIVEAFRKYCKTKVRSATQMMDWLHQNPNIGQKIMEENPSYVFFKSYNGDSPIGAQGVILTAERSIAIDAKIYPYGLPIWVETTSPQTSHSTTLVYNRLFIAQDTGGAIKGAIRGDIFYGRGNIAQEFAAYMNNKGKYFVLFPKTVAVPSAYQAK